MILSDFQIGPVDSRCCALGDSKYEIKVLVVRSHSVLKSAFPCKIISVIPRFKITVW